MCTTSAHHVPRMILIYLSPATGVGRCHGDLSLARRPTPTSSVYSKVVINGTRKFNAREPGLRSSIYTLTARRVNALLTISLKYMDT